MFISNFQFNNIDLQDGERITCLLSTKDWDFVGTSNGRIFCRKYRDFNEKFILSEDSWISDSSIVSLRSEDGITIFAYYKNGVAGISRDCGYTWYWGGRSIILDEDKDRCAVVATLEKLDAVCVELLEQIRELRKVAIK